MYCVKCGVELSAGTAVCPLCGTRVYHPDLQEKAEPAPYPRYTEGDATVSHFGLLFIVSFLFAIPLVLCLMIDLHLRGGITWSGYVACSLAVAYVCVCLPLWFRKPNPVIFFPVAMAACTLLTLYISIKTRGGWFLPFAFPVAGAVLVIVEAVIVLMRYAVGPYRHRALFIFGGAIIALGLLLLLMEFLIKVAFRLAMSGWSLYALTALVLIGLMLIIIGICRPLRQSLHKKFFI